MSKLSYIVQDIRQFVHVPMGKDRAVLLRVKEIDTRKGVKRVFNPVMFSLASPKGGRPFWVETPFIRKADKERFERVSKELKLKALQHLND